MRLSSAIWSRWKPPRPTLRPLSPPPFMVGAAEVEVDTETGEVKVLEFDACVDCGTPINPNLTRVQAEGGILQGIGMTLTENVTYDRKGCPEETRCSSTRSPPASTSEKSTWSLRTATSQTARLVQNPSVRWSSTRRCRPFQTPIYNAIGTRFYELPITPSRLPWPPLKTTNDRGTAVSVSGGKRPCGLAGGRRRKNNAAVCHGQPLRAERLAGAGVHYHPHPAPGENGLWAKTDAEYRNSGPAALMPWWALRLPTVS